MRRAVRTNASLHCAAVRRSASPERIAATNTPVPAVDNQFKVNLAASGFASALATGGIRCTRLCSEGMSHTGAENAFRVFLNAGMPHKAQQRMRMAHGVHANIVFLKSPCSLCLCGESLSDFKRNRVFGCQTNRKKSAVQMTEKTPATTSVTRCNDDIPDATYCIAANVAPQMSAPGHTSNACFQVPP